MRRAIQYRWYTFWLCMGLLILSFGINILTRLDIGWDSLFLFCILILILGVPLVFLFSQDSYERKSIIVSHNDPFPFYLFPLILFVLFGFQIEDWLGLYFLPYQLGLVTIYVGFQIAFYYRIKARKANLKIEQGVINWPDNYQNLYKNACVLYPLGPQDNGIWRRARGRLGELNVQGAGIFTWYVAIDKLLQNEVSNVTYEGLRGTMIEDYPNNNNL